MLSKVSILLVLLVTLVSSVVGADVEAVNCSHKSIDVVFVVDGSSSIGVADFERYTKSFLQGFASHLKFNVKTQPSRVSVVQFSSTDRTRLVLPLAGDKQMVDRALSGLKRIGGGQTDTARGLELAFKQFKQSVDLDHKRVVVLLTDGHNTDGEDPVEVSKRLQEEFNAQVVAIGVGRGVNAGFLDSIASAPVNRNAFHIELLSKLNALVDPLVQRVCASSGSAVALSAEETNTLANLQSADTEAVSEGVYAQTAQTEAVSEGVSAQMAPVQDAVSEGVTAQSAQTEAVSEGVSAQMAPVQDAVSEGVTAQTAEIQEAVGEGVSAPMEDTEAVSEGVAVLRLDTCGRRCRREPLCSVCTASGKKYANACFAACKGETVAPCKECKCPLDNAPVCTRGGKKYLNACFAGCAKAKVVPCKKKHDKCNCPKVFKVQNLCGESGRKYASKCHARCRGDRLVKCHKCK